MTRDLFNVPSSRRRRPASRWTHLAATVAVCALTVWAGAGHRAIAQATPPAADQAQTPDAKLTPEEIAKRKKKLLEEQKLKEQQKLNDAKGKGPALPPAAGTQPTPDGKKPAVTTAPVPTPPVSCHRA